MKIILGILIVSLSSLAVGQRKTPLDDPQVRQETVQRAFDEVSKGIYTSWSEKYLWRLGDSAAPEIMKIVTTRNPNNTKNLNKKDAETALALVNMSFALPRIITHSEHKTPTNSLILLQYLESHVADADTKSKINSAREKLKSQAAGTPPG